jgi:hypothetical protein
MRVLRGKRSRIVAVVVAVLVLLLAVFTVILFIKPDLNAPEKADAIVVLGGANTQSPFVGAKLRQEGYAPTLAISVPPGYPYIQKAMEYYDPTVHPLYFVAEPQTTQGEARSIAHFASLLHWKRIIVVMPITQASRARIRIGRCYSGQVLEVGVEPQGFWDWVRGIVYEWGAMGKALLLQRTC